MPELDFIDVRDVNSCRVSSLSIHGKRLPKGALGVVGGLDHGSEITFDTKNAQKLVDYLYANFDLTLPSLK